MTKIQQRLIVLFDGTWNDPQDRTNVYRLARAILDHDSHGVRQRFFYDPGVGTGPIDRFRGGVFGFGLSENMLQGYDWLARNFTDDSEIYVFGFSRGAYTARSLVGLINKCGLLHVSTPDLLAAAEKLYHNKAEKPDGPAASRFQQQYSRQADIHCVGVWDTVGTLGVPGTMLSEKGRYSWHDTSLSKIVKRAYQALALDEHRGAYDAVLWTAAGDMIQSDPIEVEQRWFIGAHANVGGGYARHNGDHGYDPFAALSFRWMHEKAAAAGLELSPCEPPTSDWLREAPRDSFKEFLGGAYSVLRKITEPGDGRHFRRYDKDANGNQALAVTVDPSVWARWRNDPEYRPPTLTLAGLTPPDEPPGA